MRMQVVAEIVTAKALVAQTEPFKAECSACSDERDAAACECRLVPCHESNRLRMRAVAVL